MDNEAQELLKDVPVEVGDGFMQANSLNASVYVDKQGRLNIFLKTGGWLGVDVELLQGDVAPFSD